MNPIALFFGLVVLAISVFFVASPFRFAEPKKKSNGRGNSLQGGMKAAPEKQRQAVLLALRDLDFDFQAGKVAEEDYLALRASLVKEAAELMQDEERQKEDSIEAMIRSRRQSRSVAQPASKGKERVLAEGVCRHCQAPLQKGAKFCSKCGKPVVEAVCPKCKQTLYPGDRFCPACGNAALDYDDPGQKGNSI